MDAEDLLETYSEIRECDYKGEHYSVRDNGAIMRHPKSGRSRKADNIWTFGVKNEQNGYMHFAGSVRVHIVVATAFYGAHDSTKLVVDHIDTNRCNNRVENLRWVTRLENALNNPVTLKRITWLCGGDINKFLNDPSCLRVDKKEAQDLSWMRTVSPEEARNAYENVMRWARTPIAGDEAKKKYEGTQRDKEWMFKTPSSWSQGYEEDEQDINAQFPSVAIQRKWRTPAAFLVCPQVVDDKTLENYAKALMPGAIFSEDRYSKSSVIESGLSIDGKALIVGVAKPGNEVKGLAVARITIEDGKVVHESLGSFFTDEGAHRAFVEAQGYKWDGPDTFDDLCG